MLDISRHGDHQIRGVVNIFVIFLRDHMVEALDRCRHSGDVEAKRMAWKESLAKDLAQIFLRRVLYHLHLLDDHTLLAFQVSLFESRIYEHVGDQIESLWQLVVDNFDGESGLLVGCKGVQVAAEAVLLDGDVEGGAFLRALKDRVLDKMRDAVQLGWLVPRADPEKEPEGRAAYRRHLVGKHHQSVGQSRNANVFVHMQVIN